MTKLCVIPARGGSKRIIKKNLLPFRGRPLVSYAIETAILSKAFDKILLSTDDNEIADVGRNMGIDIYNLPIEFAKDGVGVIPALGNLVDTLDTRGEKYDVICQMLPTCFFRQVKDLRSGLKLLSKDIDSVVGVTQYDAPIKKALCRKGDLLEIYFEDSPWHTGTARTQDQQIFYHDNGSFYISWWNSFKKYHNFFKGMVKGHEIHSLNAMDIDVESDYFQIKAILEYLTQFPNDSLNKWIKLKKVLK